MNMHTKKNLLNTALENGGYGKIFKVGEYDDMIVFDGSGIINEVKDAVNICIIVDDRIYTSINFYFGKLTNINLKTNLLEYMNQRNHDDLAIKYCLDKENYIIGRSVLVMNDFNFDADAVVDFLRGVYDIVCADYEVLKRYL